MQQNKLEEIILKIKKYDQEIIWVKGLPFVVSRATEDDIERVTKGTICMD